MKKGDEGSASSSKSVRLTPKIIKAKDPLSYRLIARQLRSQFTGLDEEFVMVELAKIGTDYAAELWDKPESNGLQIQESIQRVSIKARHLMNELLHLGPVARLTVHGEWLPDPDAPPLNQLARLLWTRPGSGVESEIGEPLRFKQRQMEAFFSSPEILWLIRMQNLEEKWKPLRESYRGSGKFAKKPIDQASLLLKEHCEWLLAELGKRGKEQKFQYALSVRGLAGKIFEVVTGKRASGGQFR
ncbi:hypothetical protein [Geothrix edaphica]|uniref:hypothetical protein n=1 Tax=Geothrix edaphica TaxID=2927976 RepID=UPI002554B62A|nr:hypothetical protein [Geothrix edaphica]